MPTMDNAPDQGVLIQHLIGTDVLPFSRTGLMYEIIESVLNGGHRVRRRYIGSSAVLLMALEPLVLFEMAGLSPGTELLLETYREHWVGSRYRHDGRLRVDRRFEERRLGAAASDQKEIRLRDSIVEFGSN